MKMLRLAIWFSFIQSVWSDGNNGILTWDAQRFLSTISVRNLLKSVRNLRSSRRFSVKSRYSTSETLIEASRSEIFSRFKNAKETLLVPPDFPLSNKKQRQNEKSSMRSVVGFLCVFLPRIRFNFRHCFRLVNWKLMIKRELFSFSLLLVICFCCWSSSSSFLSSKLTSTARFSSCSVWSYLHRKHKAMRSATDSEKKKRENRRFFFFFFRRVRIKKNNVIETEKKAREKRFFYVGINQKKKKSVRSASSDEDFSFRETFNVLMNSSHQTDGRSNSIDEIRKWVASRSI